MEPKTETEAGQCIYCKRIGLIVRNPADAEWEDILPITITDCTVDPPVNRRKMICAECYEWEMAIEERCHNWYGICPDAVRQAAMQRYVDQGRWLSTADLNAICHQYGLNQSQNASAAQHSAKRPLSGRQRQ